MRFAKKRDKGWEPFSGAEIEAFYNEGGFRNFGFNKLISGGWIHQVPSGVVGAAPMYHFTEDFISRCYASATRP